MHPDATVPSDRPARPERPVTHPNRRPLGPPRRLLRPIGAYAIQGLAFWNGFAIALDSVRGQLLRLELDDDSATVLNPYNASAFMDATSIALSPPEEGETAPTLWLVRDRDVYWCSLSNLVPQHFGSLPYDADGVAVWKSTVYVSSRQAGYIYAFSRDTGRQITRFYAPGIGRENLVAHGEDLWVSDELEQTIYCLDRATGDLRFSVMAPHESPTALAFYEPPEGGESTLYVSYAAEEPYIRDDPNAEDPLQLSFRDRTFIHALDYSYNEAGRYALSNGYLVEMFYVEEIAPLDAVDFSKVQNLEWRIALPSNTDRQKVRSVEPVGIPFEEEIEDGQRVAVFRFPSLQAGEGRLFGWKAIVEVRGIRYHLTPRDAESLDREPLPEGYGDRYLVDNDDLAMDNPTVIAAAREAVGRETNGLRRMLAIRNYVYDRLSYRLCARIETPDLVLERGTGSCGEYVGVLLAMARLNGIACRTVGRYKCPGPGDRVQVPLHPDYNHVWLEFYLPGFGWLPMESNPDDIQEGGPYPTRYFMGLPWNHVEIAKGIRFQGLRVEGVPPEGISVGDLAMNHVRFRILEELPPFGSDGLT